ncbi:hypothetical protein HOY80DRAFT_1098105 [Tuber brumale]|nr:hypothetical protein HOY80DRAFT_1098105 [Tuber brumale]
MRIPAAKILLNVPLTLRGIPVKQMREWEYAGGYPTEANSDFKEADISDIVAFTIYPILNMFKHETTRKSYLLRQKGITAMDYISLRRKKYVFIVEAKKVSRGEARKVCFLAPMDMWDRNGGDPVCGFVTMGDSRRMISFDGKFKISEKLDLMFDTMDEGEERWMADYSILIDCFNVALSNGAKDLVEVI